MFNQDLMLFKDEMLKSIREMEKKIMSKVIKNQNELTNNINDIIDSINILKENNKSIIESLTEHKVSINKITDIESEIKKINTTVSNQELKINNTIEELSYIREKCEKSISDFNVPGIIGYNCKYNNLNDYIISNVKEIQKLKTEKDNTKKENKELRQKVDQGLKSISNLVDSFISRSKSYTDNSKRLIIELMEIKLNEIDEKNKDLMLKLSKVDVDTGEKIKIFGEEIDNFSKKKNEQDQKMEDKLHSIDYNVEEMNKKLDLTKKELKLLKNNEEQYKSDINQLRNILKEVFVNNEEKATDINIINEENNILNNNNNNKINDLNNINNYNINNNNYNNNINNNYKINNDNNNNNQEINSYKNINNENNKIKSNIKKNTFIELLPITSSTRIIPKNDNIEINKNRFNSLNTKSLKNHKISLFQNKEDFNNIINRNYNNSIINTRFNNIFSYDNFSSNKKQNKNLTDRSESQLKKINGMINSFLKNKKEAEDNQNKSVEMDNTVDEENIKKEDESIEKTASNIKKYNQTYYSASDKKNIINLKNKLRINEEYLSSEENPISENRRINQKNNSNIQKSNKINQYSLELNLNENNNNNYDQTDTDKNIIDNKNNQENMFLNKNIKNDAELLTINKDKLKENINPFPIIHDRKTFTTEDFPKYPFLNSEEYLNTENSNKRRIKIRNNSTIKNNEIGIDKETGIGCSIVKLGLDDNIITPYNTNGLLVMASKKYLNKHLIKLNDSTPLEDIYILKNKDININHINHSQKKTINYNRTSQLLNNNIISDKIDNIKNENNNTYDKGTSMSINRISPNQRGKSKLDIVKKKNNMK